MNISLYEPALAETSGFSFCCWKTLEGPEQLNPPDPGDALLSPAGTLKPSFAPDQQGSAERGGQGLDAIEALPIKSGQCKRETTQSSARRVRGPEQPRAPDTSSGPELRF